MDLQKLVAKATHLLEKFLLWNHIFLEIHLTFSKENFETNITDYINSLKKNNFKISTAIFDNCANIIIP